MSLDCSSVKLRGECENRTKKQDLFIFLRFLRLSLSHLAVFGLYMTHIFLVHDLVIFVRFSFWVKCVGVGVIWVATTVVVDIVRSAVVGDAFYDDERENWVRVIASAESQARKERSGEYDEAVKYLL